eukprot:4565527-Pyramimonas_sp.AAC.2
MASSIAKRLRKELLDTPAQGARRSRWCHYTVSRVLSMLASRLSQHSSPTLFFRAGTAVKWPRRIASITRMRALTRTPCRGTLGDYWQISVAESTGGYQCVKSSNTQDAMSTTRPHWLDQDACQRLRDTSVCSHQNARHAIYRYSKGMLNRSC